MLASTITNYTNPRHILNTTYFGAQGLGKRCQEWSKYNFKYRFLPPSYIALRLLPIDPNTDPEPFEESMFGPKGFLHEVPMNFFLKFIPYNWRFQPQPAVLLSAGYLLNHLLMGDDVFYTELKRLLYNTELLPLSAKQEDAEEPIPDPQEGAD